MIRELWNECRHPIFTTLRRFFSLIILHIYIYCRWTTLLRRTEILECRETINGDCICGITGTYHSSESKVTRQFNGNVQNKTRCSTTYLRKSSLSCICCIWVYLPSTARVLGSILGLTGEENEKIWYSSTWNYDVFRAVIIYCTRRLCWVTLIIKFHSRYHIVMLIDLILESVCLSWRIKLRPKEFSNHAFA